jgi:hypothetical protein
MKEMEGFAVGTPQVVELNIPQNYYFDRESVK